MPGPHPYVRCCALTAARRPPPAPARELREGGRRKLTERGGRKLVVGRSCRGRGKDKVRERRRREKIGARRPSKTYLVLLVIQIITK